MSDHARMEAPNSARILFRNGSLAVVNKRIGEVCEGPDAAHSLIGAVRPDLERLAGRPLPEIAAVHRIDQPVSGCVLVALDKDACSRLSRQFTEGTVRKKYLAIVEIRGDIAPEGRLEGLIRFDSVRHKATVLPSGEKPRSASGWKKASLEWTLAGRGERYAFLEIRPETGRTHQIRAQLAAAGMPIKGDLKYGARRSDPLGGIRLHASVIQFHDPDTGDTIVVIAPIESPDALWTAFPGIQGCS